MSEQVGNGRKPTKLHMLPLSKFPATLRIYSGKTGEELWSTTIPMPNGPTELVAVDIPGWGGTEHVPVKCRIEYADGTTEEWQ